MSNEQKRRVTGKTAVGSRGPTRGHAAPPKEARLKDELEPVMVTWVDSTSSDGWFNHKEIDEFCQEPPLTMETMGWLIFEVGGWIVLAMSAGLYNMGDLFKIPRSAIVSIEPVSFGGDHERV